MIITETETVPGNLKNPDQFNNIITRWFYFLSELNLNLFLGRSRSSTQCQPDTKKENIVHIDSNVRPSGHDFYSLETTPTDFYTSKRTRNCRLRCQGKCKRVRWSGCVSFSSTIPNEYGNECNCYGWKSLPDFGPAAELTEKATHLSGYCVTEFFERGMIS